MDKAPLKSTISSYAGQCIVLNTANAKSVAIAPLLWEKLGVGVIEHTSGSAAFSGADVPLAEEDLLSVARRKAEHTQALLGDKAPLALATAARFSPPPSMSGTRQHHEVLYFIDRTQNFTLSVSTVTEQTNYRSQVVSSFEELMDFANRVSFPSHALILRPYHALTGKSHFKGLHSQEALEQAYAACLKDSSDKKVWVQTDMHVQHNPSRKAILQALAVKLASRLQTHCPACLSPGWGAADDAAEVLECPACHHQQSIHKPIAAPLHSA